MNDLAKLNSSKSRASNVNFFVGFFAIVTTIAVMTSNVFSDSKPPVKQPDRDQVSVVFIGNPAGWSARYLRSYVERQGAVFDAVFLQEPGDRQSGDLQRENKQVFARTIKNAEALIKTADVVVVHEASWIDTRLFGLAEAIAKRARAGDMKLVFLGKGSKKDYPANSPLAALSPIKRHHLIQPAPNVRKGRIVVGTNSVETTLFGNLLVVEPKDSATAIARFDTDDKKFPLVVGGNDGKTASFLITTQGLFRMRGSKIGVSIFELIAKNLAPNVSEKEIANSEILFVPSATTWDCRMIQREWQRLGFRVHSVDELLRQLPPQSQQIDGARQHEFTDKKIDGASLLVVNATNLGSNDKILTDEQVKKIVKRVKSGELQLGFVVGNNGIPKSIPKKLIELLPVKSYKLDRIQDRPKKVQIEFDDRKTEFDLADLFDNVQLKDGAIILSKVSRNGHSRPFITKFSNDKSTSYFVGTSQLWRLRRGSAETYDGIWAQILQINQKRGDKKSKKN
jgi:uncharacterized membrane protein